MYIQKIDYYLILSFMMRILLLSLLFILLNMTNVFSQKNYTDDNKPMINLRRESPSSFGKKVITDAIPGRHIFKAAPIQNRNEFVPGVYAQGDVLATGNGKELLFRGDFVSFKVNIEDKTVDFLPLEYELDSRCYDAIDRAPNWMKYDLILKFRIMREYNMDGTLAQLILDADEKYVDEVAFVVAHMSEQALSHWRFRKDIEMVIRNAEAIYTIADSLKYVELVEYGDFESGDYYTTTKYMVRSGVDGPQGWVEAPKEIYYWYVVHPKIRQEGVYVEDDPGNDQQRTYNFSWRDYIWLNPNPDYDYTHVNKSTNKGSVTDIARFGERIKKAEILWDRVKSYYTFNRDYKADDNALNIIGNWCSRAIPVDAELPRAIQPNQALYEHNGNCGEDAYLVAATCRTALIPIIHRNTSCEDHAFGAIWCDDAWHHFEFFRGGLAGNDFYGITNMLVGGSYSWVTSIVEGYRPDGYCINHTEEYTEQCTINLNIYSADSIPVDGAQVIFWANPNSYGQNGYFKSGQAWTDSKGHVSIKPGAQSDNTGKKYAIQIYHPEFGIFPSADQVWLFINTSARTGQEYSGNIYFPSGKMPSPDKMELMATPAESDFGLRLNVEIKDIINGSIYDEEISWDEFHYWNDEESGIIGGYICNAENYQKLFAGEDFEAYAYKRDIENGEIDFLLPEKGEWYLVLTNKYALHNLKYIEAQCELIEGPVINAIEEYDREESDLYASPNPFGESCRIEAPETCEYVEIIDIFGNIRAKLSAPFIWPPDNNIPEGVYFARVNDYGRISSIKIIYSK